MILDDKKALDELQPEGLGSGDVEDMVRNFFVNCDPVSYAWAVIIIFLKH